MDSNNCHGGRCNHQSVSRIRNVCKAVGPFTAPEVACTNPLVRTGTMIPYASGRIPVIMNTTPSGSAFAYSFVGFSDAVSVPGPLFNPINVAAISDEAFSVSRSGILTAISASYTEPTNVNLGNRVFIINARVYHATAGSTSFFATNAAVDMNPLTGNIIAGTTVHGEKENFVPVPVKAGDRLLMVISMTEIGAIGSGNLQGRVSAGITIE